MDINMDMDLLVVDHGTIWLLFALTPVGEAWAEENLDSERQRWGGNCSVIEARYIGPVIAGAEAAGLAVVEGEGA